jgi:hypothetical protein
VALGTLCLQLACQAPGKLPPRTDLHAEFAAISTFPVHKRLHAAVLGGAVSARRCYATARGDGRAILPQGLVIQYAVEDALAQHSGANALVDAQFFDDGPCIEVTGIPVRVE